MPKLENKRHEMFCNYYIIDFNGTKAAISARYSEKTAVVQASQLLRKLKVQQRIQELLKKEKEQCWLTEEYVLGELKETYEKCAGKKPIKTTYWGKESESHDFNASGANKSLELLGKHKGMFTDRVEVKDTTPQIVVASEQDKAALEVDY